MRNFIGRAEAAGYKAIVLTVGLPVSGKRHNGFCCAFAVLPHPNTKEALESKNTSEVGTFNIKDVQDPLVIWETIIPWKKSITSLLVVLTDAKLVVKCGIDRIIVSNHGGRKIDVALATECNDFS